VPAPRRTRLLALVPTVLSAMLVATLLPTGPAHGASLDARTAPRAAAAALRTVWIDNFSGRAMTLPSSSKWRFDTGGNGFGNKEKEYYTNTTSNVRVDGAGHLLIVARKENRGLHCWYGPCQYTSGKITTAGKFSQKYGRVEARMKIPVGRGIWPAFWMLGTNINDVGWPACGEIDIMENVGQIPGTVYGTLHGPGYGTGGSATLPSAQRFTDAFHTYGIQWAPNEVQFLLDGHVYATRTPANVPGKKWVFNHPFYLILNLAVGGTWPGDPDSSTVFTQALEVDYVAVYA
jgi:beta-glucanase (GH16 family)